VRGGRHVTVVHYARCDGCNFLVEGDTHPSTWVRLTIGDEESFYCSRSCLFAANPQYVRRANPFGITEDELQVLEMVGKGMSNKEIALALSQAESTIKNRLVSIFKKVGVSDRTQALLAAQALGLINVPRLAEQFFGGRSAGHWHREVALPAQATASGADHQNTIA
jgi:DNA-binding CsgD family transcriptional regulator